MTKIYYTSQFIKSIKKIPKNVVVIFHEKQTYLIVNPYNPLLKTHKLKGKLKGYFSFSVNIEYRVIFKVMEKNKILLLDIGTHEIYKN